jgi:hypothetical protein
VPVRVVLQDYRLRGNSKRSFALIHPAAPTGKNVRS